MTQLFTLPSSESKATLFTKIPIAVSVTCFLPILLGLIARKQVDKRMLEVYENPDSEQAKLSPLTTFLSKMYTVAFAVTALGGAVNGLAYASFCRMFSYMAMFVGALFNMRNEFRVINNTNQAIELSNDIHKAQKKDFGSKDTRHIEEIKKELQETIQKANQGVGWLAFFSRFLYPIFLALTFFSNVNQLLGKGHKNIRCLVPEGATNGQMWQNIKKNFWPNARKEFQTGGMFSRKLLSGKHWGEVFGAIGTGFKTGKWQGLSASGFDASFILMNMWSRVLMAVGTMVGMVGLGGPKAFLVGTPLFEKSDPEVRAISEQAKGKKKFFKGLFDTSLLIQNLSLFSMGTSSVMMGFNAEYAKNFGTIPSTLQKIGGGLLGASPVFDQMNLFVVGAISKLLSNTVLQLANAFGLAKKFVDKAGPIARAVKV